MSLTYRKTEISKRKEAPAACPSDELAKSRTRRFSTTMKILLFVLPVWLLLVLCSLFSGGCSTPFYATDNAFMLHLPGTERKSDRIEGVLRPWERLALIQEKGDKGRHVKTEEKAIIVQQLNEEYHTTQSPNIRRACVDALGNICATMPDRDTENTFAAAVIDENLNVRVSGAEAWSRYCDELPKSMAGEKEQYRRVAADKLWEIFKSLPYSVEPGSKNENDDKKDLRLATIRGLRRFHVEDSSEILPTLQMALEGEMLDDGALQTEAMLALERVTGKKYGLNAKQWSEYIAYTRHDRTAAPKELSALEQLPSPDLPMFK